MRVDLFDYHLPSDRIAQKPAQPRDSARMLVVSESLADSNIADLPSFLKPNDILVFNDTKVIPARLYGKRGTTQIEILLHKPAGKNWHAFARPAKRLKIDDEIIFANDFSARVVGKLEDGQIELLFNEPETFFQTLQRYGLMPLPPYIKREKTGDDADESDYQTLFARHEGSVAAPTAGLHFTPELLKRLEAKQISFAYVTLHVGAGTFQPVKVDDTESHQMHSEWADVSRETIDRIKAARARGGRVIAVGTTALRTLESAAKAHDKLAPFRAETNLFIIPGFQFRVVDILLTNFHLPRSTLYMLVSAFAGMDKIKAAYTHAINSQYRFYSYGDACLLYRAS